MKLYRGAISVGYQILAYNGRDDKLFSGAISQSGPTWGVGLVNAISCEKSLFPISLPFGSDRSLATAEQNYQRVISAVGCANATDKLACLRLVPTDQLNDVLNHTADAGDYYEAYYGPLIDNDIVARDGISQLEDGSFVKVPYIIGDTSDEGTDFVPFGINTDEDLIGYLKGYNLTNSTITMLLDLYPQDSPSLIPSTHPSQFNSSIGHQYKRTATLLTDIIFKAPRRLVAQSWLNHTVPNSSDTTITTAPLYTYRFATIPNGIPDEYSATHFQEVAFVFHNIHGQGYPDINPPYFGPNPFANKPESYIQLSDLMSKMWISFIHDGNPNYSLRKLPTPLPPSPDYIHPSSPNSSSTN